jgi:hypothetical protein
MCSEVFRSSRVAFSQLEPRLGESFGKLSLFEKGSRGRQENRDFAAPNALERLDALTRHFRVRLYFAEPFARRIERNEARVTERLEVSQPSLRTRYAFGDNHEKAAVTGMRERGYNERVAGTWQTGSVYPAI